MLENIRKAGQKKPPPITPEPDTSPQLTAETEEVIPVNPAAQYRKDYISPESDQSGVTELPAIQTEGVKGYEDLVAPQEQEQFIPEKDNGEGTGAAPPKKKKPSQSKTKTPYIPSSGNLTANLSNDYLKRGLEEPSYNEELKNEIFRYLNYASKFGKYGEPFRQEAISTYYPLLYKPAKEYKFDKNNVIRNADGTASMFDITTGDFVPIKDKQGNPLQYASVFPEYVQPHPKLVPFRHVVNGEAKLYYHEQGNPQNIIPTDINWGDFNENPLDYEKLQTQLEIAGLNNQTRLMIAQMRGNRGNGNGDGSGSTIVPALYGDLIKAATDMRALKGQLGNNLMSRESLQDMINNNKDIGSNSYAKASLQYWQLFDQIKNSNIVDPEDFMNKSAYFSLYNDKAGKKYNEEAFKDYLKGNEEKLRQVDWNTPEGWKKGYNQMYDNYMKNRDPQTYKWLTNPANVAYAKQLGIDIKQ